MFNSRYSGKEMVSNMLILDIALLSGFVPDPESLKNVGSHSDCDLILGEHESFCTHINSDKKALNVISSQLDVPPLVDRVEHKDGHVLVYFDGVRRIQNMGYYTTLFEFVTNGVICLSVVFSTLRM